MRKEKREKKGFDQIAEGREKERISNHGGCFCKFL